MIGGKGIGLLGLLQMYTQTHVPFPPLAEQTRIVQR